VSHRLLVATARATSIARWLTVTAVLTLTACSTVPRGGGYYQDDGPHDKAPVDASQVPDAVPRAEPLSAYGNKPYTVFGVNYRPLSDASGYRERGVASWYGKKFHGRRTSSGEPYDMYGMSAAHRTLPLPSYVRVRNLENGRTVVVRVNDRGPFLHNRLIDLSYTAAARLGVLGKGTAMVEVETIGPQGPANVATAAPRPSLVRRAEAAGGDTIPPRLSVQVGAFSEHQNALNLKTRLEQAGFVPIYIQPPSASGGAGSLYRVRVGPLPSVERGDRLVADITRHGIADAVLVVE
jgi:rare lipoprotein A